MSIRIHVKEADKVQLPMGERLFMVSESKNDQFSAYCKIYKKRFSVSCGGICLVKQHEKTKAHIFRTEELCNQLLFQKGSGSVAELNKSIQFSDEEKITRAEILQALNCVQMQIGLFSLLMTKENN